MFKNVESGCFVRDITCLDYGPFCDGKAINYYDKDGYELTDLEKELYVVNGFGLGDVLNKQLFCRPWLVWDDKFYGDDHCIQLDHCMLLMRCDFGGSCLENLLRLQKSNRNVAFLLHLVS